MAIKVAIDLGILYWRNTNDMKIDEEIEARRSAWDLRLDSLLSEKSFFFERITALTRSIFDKTVIINVITNHIKVPIYKNRE